MSWIERQIKRIDKGIENSKLLIIKKITYEDMIRNGYCSKKDFKMATKEHSDKEIYYDTRKKIKKVVEISCSLVRNL